MMVPAKTARNKKGLGLNGYKTKPFKQACTDYSDYNMTTSCQEKALQVIYRNACMPCADCVWPVLVGLLLYVKRRPG